PAAVQPAVRAAAARRLAHRPRARGRAVVRALAGPGRGLHDRRTVPAVAADAAAAQRAVDRAAVAGACWPVAGPGPVGLAPAGIGRGDPGQARVRTTRDVGGATPSCATCLPRIRGRGTMPPMTPAADDKPDDKPQVPACVVTAAVYSASGKLRDISLDQISDVLANDAGCFVW